jgi:two-component system sensor histidine kinase QseC
MKRSIRTFLLINLLLSITVIILLVIIGNFYLASKDFRKHLDNQLTYTAVTIQSIIKKDKQIDFPIMQKKLNRKPILLDKNKAKTLSGIQFEVFSKEDKPLLHSLNAPPIASCYAKLGFNDCLINKNLWRVFVSRDPITHDKVIVAERYSLRNQLANRATHDLIIILLMSYPLLGFLIWFITGRGLSSIRKVTKEVRQRAAGHLQTVDIDNVPVEVKPLVDELNELFIRLHAAFQREKRFATDAAHELKTPLAALRTQTQVAINVTDEEERKAALNKILECVDRSTHTVQQLLVLSRMLPETMLEEAKKINLNKEAAQVIADLVPDARKKQIEIELIAPDKPQVIMGNVVAINILLRNLIDNAIRYTPCAGSVKVLIESSRNFVILRVIDTGLGIPEKLRKRVFERFFRVIGNEAPGSGLGFSIIQQIAQLHNARINLLTPESGKGLEVKIVFPKANKS